MELSGGFYDDAFAVFRLIPQFYRLYENLIVHPTGHAWFPMSPFVAIGFATTKEM